MTPEEIQQVVEDYRKSSQSLNEFIKVDFNKLRNLGRDKRDQVNGDENKKNGNGAQGATNGAQGAQSSTTGAQGAQSNDNVGVGAQGNGAQSSTTGAQGAQSNNNVNVGAQGNGAQGSQTNTVKNQINLDAMSKYSRKGPEVTIKDFGGITPTGAQGAQTNEVKPKISPATFSTNQRQSRELVKSGELKDTDLNKYSRSSTYTADDGKTQVNRSTVNTIAQFDMGPNIKKGDKLGVISNNLRKKYDLKAANFKAEAYDVLLDYVLTEGHADSVEEAHYVMMQMDEETIKEFIKKAALIGTGGYLAYKGLKKAGDSFNNMLNNLRNNSKLGGNKRVDDVRKNSDDPNVGQKYYFGAQGNKP
tara:strand:- start:44 stop:1123 length:1080 start_codon:yes stop_codon:yes gene_type:complete